MEELVQVYERKDKSMEESEFLLCFRKKNIYIYTQTKLRLKLKKKCDSKFFLQVS